MEEKVAPSPPKLCYRALPNKRPEPAGMMTPPPQAPGRVPFVWEEAPGKPRNTSRSDGIKPTVARGLELPPRLASSKWQVAKVEDEELPSKTVLDGTYYVLLDPPDSQVDDMRAKRRGRQLSCSSFTFGDRSFGKRRKKRSSAWFWKTSEQKKSSGGDSSEKTGVGNHHPLSSHSYRLHMQKSEKETEAEGAANKATITRHMRSSSLPRLSTSTSHLLVHSFHLFFSVIFSLIHTNGSLTKILQVRTA